MAPPHRMDHIGSLLRPASLLEARSSLSSPSNLYTIPSDHKIKLAEQQAIQTIVSKQQTLCIRPITSGEFCRHIYYGGLFEKLSGMTPMPNLPIPEAFLSYRFPHYNRPRENGRKDSCGCDLHGTDSLGGKCVFGRMENVDCDPTEGFMARV
ncbi:uncharacterized protein RCC_05646 [Ramularia collo-cygni]|uniref:Uncharacterized protein n=1 Tax=Ramularia collo-cygni TaxID=112498 RepID=A0A2D3V2U7_9PEZI|nr:uncharacterized protein RCC_05646 [Ramularia collo-cygni]CZT19790.1 uncharacterized protein RCC_05646 [Ramularia collo-cygni]